MFLTPGHQQLHGWLTILKYFLCHFCGFTQSDMLMCLVLYYNQMVYRTKCKLATQCQLVTQQCVCENSHREYNSLISSIIISNNHCLSFNSPISQITQCIRQIFHNAPFCNRNVHPCAHFCYKGVHCGILGWHIVSFVKVITNLSAFVIQI